MWKTGWPPSVSNFSKQLENIVFLKLKRDQKTLSFGALSSGKEIDFIAQAKDGSIEKYQVTQTLQDDNYEREMSSFLMTDTNLEFGDNILLTLDGDEREIQYSNVKVAKRNIPVWLLGLRQN